VSAFDDHVNDALNRALDSLKAHVETALVACREDLVRAAADEINRLAAESESARAEAAQAAERQLGEWREAAARDAEERDVDIEARERQAEAREHDAEARELEADTQRREAEARQQATERALEDVRRALEDARRQNQQDVDTVREDAERVRALLEERLHDIRTFENQVRGFEGELADAARLPDAIRALDAASSLGEALDGLVHAAAREAGRAVVFLVKGDRLHDWRTVGFGNVPSERIQIPVYEAGPFEAAVRSGRGVARGDRLPAFAAGSGPRYAVTMPVTVAGAVVAILYADGPDADKEIEPVWPARLDVLARYAGRMLESITIRQAAGLSAARVVRTGSASHASSPPAGSVQ
jgi:hypothetical protein